MTTPTFPIGDLRSVLDYLSGADPDSALVSCDISRILLGHDQVDRLAVLVQELLDGRGLGAGHLRGKVTLIVDATTIRRSGVDVKRQVEDLLRGSFIVHTEVLRGSSTELHADENALATAATAAAGADAVVTVGSGTITDIGKIASQAAGGVPLVVVQTAASVDGFTDNVSVVLRSGVKRTIDSRWPDVVIADVDVISEAPSAMNRAGFGEITSMFTAPADWKLANLLGMDDTFHAAPIQLLGAVGADIATWASGVASADVDSIARLTWALAVRGIATGVAGTTACLSGVEHIVSHMLDLHHGENHLPMGLHGAQVGVAAVVAAAAWELLFERLEAGRRQRPEVDVTQAHSDVLAAFGHLGGGEVAAECWADYSGKLTRWSASGPHVDRVMSSWSENLPVLRDLVRPSADIAAHLRAAGAPSTFAELDPAVSPELARWAVANCALMRNRFTVVDLLTFLGCWSSDDVDEVLRRAEQAGAASPAVTPGVARGGEQPR